MTLAEADETGKEHSGDKDARPAKRKASRDKRAEAKDARKKAAKAKHVEAKDAARSPAPPSGPGRDSLSRKLRGPAIASLMTAALFFGGFGYWAATVPISSGAVALGRISPEGNRRTVQHLEGGIIAELYVKNGDVVSAGDPLLLLERTRAEAGDSMLAVRQLTLRAMIARLQSEQAKASRINYPEELLAATDPEIVQLRATQDAVFNSRRNSRIATNSALLAQIDQLESEIVGLEALIASQDNQLALVSSETATLESLLADGLTAESRVMDMKRRQVELIGVRADNQAKIARARQTISEKQLEIANVEARLQAEIAEQLDTARLELSSVTTERSASSDVLNRTAVMAPVSGKVVELQVNTLGGVIRAGDAILSIVPAEAELIIEARVQPLDIDVVTAGMPANVRVTTFNQRQLPRLTGTVRTVAADTSLDEITGQPYFPVKVEVNKAELEALEARMGIQLQLSAGMTAEVLIVTGERTLLEYLWQPLSESIDQAFREG